MSKDNQDKWEKKANQLDIVMLFVHGCNNNKICKDQKRMIAFNKIITHKTLYWLVIYIVQNVLRQKCQQTTTAMRLMTRVRIKMIKRRIELDVHT